ncbi:PfkB family carbohydrate kinase [Domibacillus enclensis]|uniref:Fructoselysine 6-kinase n=1 Tax=Domibacillus enclensis TaxID=1017273 RepID=A0A1N7C3T1_9BACI|nr:PfkB family carbohydrate kinase [Domibacillus enclensis]OXS74223.1 fructoselysine kinase [Domibacillus enclensis]SIR58103.1 fructoselysine 6-kinase [Domibacillus enclensis]
MKLIAIGDNVVDFYENLGILYPGGNAVNVAVASKRAGAVSSAYLGIIGNDAKAAHVTKSLLSEAIDISRLRKVYGENGEAVITLTKEGDRVFMGTNKGIRVQSLLRLALGEQDLDYINQYDVVHMSVNSETDHELPKLSHKEISFDFSTSNRWDEKYLKKICPNVDFAFFSGSDMTMKQIKELMKNVHELGVKIVGVTRGEKPAMFSEFGKVYEQDPLEAKVIDTMGAGDSFIGTFLTAYCSDKNIKIALNKAAKAAATTCECNGAFGYGIEKKTLV